MHLTGASDVDTAADGLVSSKDPTEHTTTSTCQDDDHVSERRMVLDLVAAAVRAVPGLAPPAAVLTRSRYS